MVKGNKTIGGLIVKFGQMVSNGECGLDDDEINEIVEIIATKKITMEQTADMLNCDRTTLSRKIRHGEIPSPRKDKGSKKYYFKKDLIQIKK